MAKYEIEIDDLTVALWHDRLSGGLLNASTGLPDSAVVGSSIQELIGRYGKFPETIGVRNRAAMAICRNIAAERAAAFGPHSSGIEQTADDILRFMLGGNNG